MRILHQGCCVVSVHELKQEVNPSIEPLAEATECVCKILIPLGGFHEVRTHWGGGGRSWKPRLNRTTLGPGGRPLCMYAFDINLNSWPTSHEVKLLQSTSSAIYKRQTVPFQRLPPVVLLRLLASCLGGYGFIGLLIQYVRIPLLPPSPSSYQVIFWATSTLPPTDVICTCPLIPTVIQTPQLLDWSSGILSTYAQWLLGEKIQVPKIRSRISRS